MKKLAKYFLLILINANVYGQFNSAGFAVSAGASYTTTANLFNHPNSSDPLVRNQYDQIEHIFSYTADIRYLIIDEITIGLSTEYMSATGVNRNISVNSPDGVKIISMIDGFVMVPVELSAYYNLPFSTARFKFFMYGGIGYYFGKHKREFGNAEFETIGFDSSPGMHVGLGAEFMITEFLSVRGEMKFRDPEFSMETKYVNTSFEAGHTAITVSRDTFNSKVNVNGITMLLSAAIHF